MLRKRHTDIETVTKSKAGARSLDFEAALTGTKLQLRTRLVQQLTEETIRRETTGWKRGEWPIWEVVIPDIDILISLGIGIYAAFSDEYALKYGAGAFFLAIVPGITCQCYGYERDFDEVEKVVEVPVSKRPFERRIAAATAVTIAGAGQSAALTTGTDGRLEASLARFACAALLQGQRSLSLRVALADQPASGQSLYLGARDLVAIADEAVKLGLIPGFTAPPRKLRQSFWGAVLEACGEQDGLIAKAARRRLQA